MTSLESFHAARDLLFQLRNDQPAAAQQFRWPVMSAFNWALDHFDSVARDNHGPALWIVGDDGSEIKRSFAELIEWLSRETSFPDGVVLLTGTGIVPPDDFTLAVGDVVQIDITGIGQLTNTVGVKP